MRGGDHDPGVALEVPDSQREQGRGPGFREQENPESRRRQHASAQLSKFRGVMPRVAGDHTRSGRIRSLASRHIVSQAPRTLGDRPLVEHIGADRVHHSAPAAGAKLEDREERVVKDFPTSYADILEQIRAVPSKRAVGQPSANRNCCRGESTEDDSA